MKIFNRILMLTLTLYICTVPGLTQPLVDVSGYPSQQTPTMLLFRDGSNNIQYVCMTKSTQASFSWTIAGSTLTSIAVATSVGTVTTSSDHGLLVDNPVTITGGPANLAGTYRILTVPTTATFTITTASVGDGTYTTAGMSVSTNSPRTNALIWSIVKNYWTGAYLDRSASSGGNANSFSFSCDSRATTKYQ